MPSEREPSKTATAPTQSPVKPAGVTLTLDETLVLEVKASRQLDRYRDIRIAAATPEVRPGHVAANEEQILALISEATQAGADVLLFSDLALTGKTAGDLFLQRTLQDACLESLARITQATAGSHLLVLLSLPLRLEERLLKATAILYHGEIVGMTPASYLSREERRWFSDPLAPGLGDHDTFSCELIAGAAGEATGIMEVRLAPAACPTILRHAIDDPPLSAKEPGADGLAGFDFSLCGITAQNLQSFTFQFVNLCTVIPCLAVRPSLLPRLVHDCDDLRLFNFEPAHAVDALDHGSIPVAAIADGRQEWTGDYRRLKRELIRRSLRDHSIVLYAGAGPGESVSSGVYAGRRLIISDGRVLAESGPFTTGMTLADLAAEDLFRVRSNAGTRWDIVKNGREKTRAGKPDPLPFLMRGELDTASFYEETLAIQGRGLSDRLRFLGARPVLGLSGGLDSAVALLACLEAVRILERPPSDVIAVSMPGPGTSEVSRMLARQLGEAAGLDFREIAIDQAVDQHLADIGYEGDRSDVTFENTQARERTQILMDLANLEGGIVVGTGDLSELALGWCTYNGDQMSMYAVNASLPKTVIREMAGQAASLLEKGRSPLITGQPEALSAAQALRAILARPVSPELLPPAGDGSLSQLTEEVVGPYELIDFFLWHLVFGQKKAPAVLELARHAFEGEYGLEEIAGWMENFIRRFFKSQFKRTASPEGVSAFPRRLVPLTAWQMPGDAAADLWISGLGEHPAREQPE